MEGFKIYNSTFEFIVQSPPPPPPPPPPIPPISGLTKSGGIWKSAVCGGRGAK